jgi:hypothetical protein
VLLGFEGVRCEKSGMSWNFHLRWVVDACGECERLEEESMVEMLSCCVSELNKVRTHNSS